jgi:hypothetical protein
MKTMSAVSPAYLELVDFLAAGTTPEALIAFRPSETVQRRVQDLVVRNEDGCLTPEEKTELEEFLQLEHILILTKAQARRRLSLAQ